MTHPKIEERVTWGLDFLLLKGLDGQHCSIG